MNTYVVCTLLLGIVSFAHAGCQFGFTAKGNRCYAILRPKTYADQEKACANLGGFLAVPAKETNADIASMITAEAYIGINDRKKKGHFVHGRTGNVLEYMNWDSNEPNNFRGNQDCGVMYHSGERKGKWDYINCYTKMHAVCEVCQNKADWGTCYNHVDTTVTKAKAQEACKNVGGRLAEPRSICEFHFIRWLIKDKSFLGFTYLPIWKKWVRDSSGGNADSLPWARGKPIHLTDEYCVEMFTNGTVDYLPCGDKRGYVCEY